MDTNYIISCCSTADLKKSHFLKSNIPYVCFHYELDGKNYFDDLGESISYKDFYHAMKSGKDTKTSQINAGEFQEFFEGFLRQGKDILHICLSSGLSGVINSANIAKQALLKLYPERKIYIVDSLGASSGYGLIMDTLSEMREDGKNIEEVYSWVESNKLNMHHWFFSTDLSFYVKGGRISKTSGFIGGMLGVCPLLNMDKEGRLIPRAKIRGKKRVIHSIVDQMEKHAAKGIHYNGKCYISQSDCYEEAEQVAKMVEERFLNMNGKVEINDVGTTIGSHTGPGTVALFFWGDSRNE